RVPSLAFRRAEAPRRNAGRLRRGRPTCSPGSARPDPPSDRRNNDARTGRRSGTVPPPPALARAALWPRASSGLQLATRHDEERAAGDADVLAQQVRGSVGGEIEDGIHHVLDLAEPPVRQRRGDDRTD